MVCIYVDAIPAHFLLALIVFAVASFTDMLDGKIARARGLVTNFGKFLDPLADKVLVITALTVLVELDEFRMSAIPLVIIIAREFMVSGLRLLAAEEGVVIAAGIWGKLKTAFTMVTIVAVLLYLSLTGLSCGNAGRCPHMGAERADLDLHRADHYLRSGLSQGLLEVYRQR